MLEYSINLDEPFFKIETAASLINIPIAALRAYNKEKLLYPGKNSENELRYSLNDIEKGQVIKYLTMDLRLDLQSVKLIIGLLENFEISPQNYMKEIENILKTKKVIPK